MSSYLTGRGAEQDAGAPAEQLNPVDAPAAEAVTTSAPGAVPTGDKAVDEALGRLDAAADEALDVQIEVGEQVHRVLQGRLADLGQE